MKIIERLAIELPTVWTLINLPKAIDRNLAQVWKKRHGLWIHGYNTQKTTSHNILGMAFAQYSEQIGALQKIRLEDSPDLVAECRGKLVCGDIGQCSPGAFHDGLRGMTDFHCLWISVLTEKEQVIIEFLYSPGWYIANNTAYNLRHVIGDWTDREEAIRRSFWCPDCQEWSLAAENRNQVWP